MEKVLIVDDDKDSRTIVRDVLNEEGFLTLEAKDGMEAIKTLRSGAPDAVLLDLNMPYMNGIETMKEILKEDAGLPVIILTAFGDIPTAVSAIKDGAYDFMVKPPEFEKLVITLRRAAERRKLERQVMTANAALTSSLEHLLGRSKAIRKVISQIQQVAQTDFSVVIQGETGTGKSVVAGAIQNLSPRTNAPFVRVDIGLIPDHLVESELFGYRKGAFTGAERDKTGYIETAHRGTIFIDELENMSPQVQTKLLSFIEKRKIYPVGSTTPVDVDVRIIAATNKDIREAVKAKEIREDLFYRIGQIIISLPPLRERIEDIPFFAKKFVFEASAELNKQIKGISDEAITALMIHRWPGNLRELKNVMRKVALFAETDVIERKIVEETVHDTSLEKDRQLCQGTPLKEALRELERKIIAETLVRTGGNKSRAAEMLGMSYKNLFDKIKEYGIRGTAEE